MKKYILIVLVVTFFSCDSENALDCFQRTGEVVSKKVEVPDFTRIIVNPNVALILKVGTPTSVTLETGKNLLDEVSAIVEGDRLMLSDTNGCNVVRGFNQTKVYVTAPDVTEIRSVTQFDISSDGVLTYPSLSLISEDFSEDTGGNTNGTFHLQVNAESVSIVGNNIASFFIEGTTTSLDVNFASGTGRFEGAGLIAENVTIFHRGANKMIVNPQQSITGEIRSTGDVISVTKPPTVKVEAFFTGKLVFQ